MLTFKIASLARPQQLFAKIWIAGAISAGIVFPAMSANLITNGDFSGGDTGFLSEYLYAPSNSVTCSYPAGMDAGCYSIETSPRDAHGGFNIFGDHSTGTGNMMVANGASDSRYVWEQTVSVQASTRYAFSAWAASAWNDPAPADLRIELDTSAACGTNTFTTIGTINATNVSGEWVQSKGSFVSSTSTQLCLRIVNQNFAGGGNDFVIDDLSMDVDTTGPTATDDNATTTLNQPVIVDILGNDTQGSEPIDTNSIDLDPSTVGNQATYTDSGKGTFTVVDSSGMKVQFSPDTDFVGTATASYRVSSTTSGTPSNVATIAVTIEAYTVTPSAGSNGSISPDTPQTINVNDTSSFTATPDAGYHVSSWDGTCGGTPSGVGNVNYTTNAVTADCSVSVSFAIDTFTVTPSAGSNGSISPDAPQTVNINDTSSFTATPDAGYHVLSWDGTCGGTPSGTGNVDYTTNAVTADCTVSVSFAIDTFTVTPSAGSNGSISPSTPQTVNINDTSSFTAIPDAGYHVSSWDGTCGGTPSGVGNVNYTTNAVTADCSVSVSFAIDTFTVTPSAGSNGSISPNTPQTININDTGSFTATPDAGYHVSSWDGTCGGTPSGVGNVNYTTNAVTADCTVSVSFAIDTFTVTPSAGSNGSISPNTPQTVNINDTSSFTATPDAGYHVSSWDGTCGGTPSGVGNVDYTTNAVTADCTVSVSFAIDTFTVTPSAGSNGSISPNTPQTININETGSFTATPDAGYHVSSWDGTCGGTPSGTGNVNYTTNAVTADCSVSVSFAIDTFTVTPSAGSNGNISPDTPQTVNINDTGSFTATPDAGYHVSSWDGTCGGTPSGTGNVNYTTNAVTADCTVSVSFAIDTFTVTPSAGSNGSISPDAPQTVEYNATTAFTITPERRYALDIPVGGTCDGSYTGDPADSVNGVIYTTDPILTDCTVSATFSLAPTEPNDDFANAIALLGYNGQTSGANALATKEPNEPKHAGDLGGGSVWWYWVAPRNGVLSLDTLGSNFDTLLAAYTGSSVDALNEVASSDNTVGPPSQVSFTVKAGLRYAIAVDGLGDAFGSITLNWSLSNDPPATPSPVYPVNGISDQSLTPVLQGSRFSDPDGDDLLGSQWQVDTDGSFNFPAWDAVSYAGTQETVASGALGFDTLYYWRVRYQDAPGDWSDWSAPATFTTQPDVPTECHSGSLTILGPEVFSTDTIIRVETAITTEGSIQLDPGVGNIHVLFEAGESVSLGPLFKDLIGAGFRVRIAPVDCGAP